MQHLLCIAAKVFARRNGDISLPSDGPHSGRHFHLGLGVLLQHVSVLGAYSVAINLVPVRAGGRPGAETAQYAFAPIFPSMITTSAMQPEWALVSKERRSPN